MRLGWAAKHRVGARTNRRSFQDRIIKDSIRGWGLIIVFLSLYGFIQCQIKFDGSKVVLRRIKLRTLITKDSSQGSDPGLVADGLLNRSLTGSMYMV